MAVAIVAYFVYGIRNSRLNKAARSDAELMAP
jgi:hypothetical protein